MRRLVQIFTLIFIFTIPWENAFTLGAIGSVARLFGLAAAGLWLVSLVFSRRLRGYNPFHLAACAFLLFNLISIFWTQSYSETFSRVKTYAQIAILLLLLWDVMDTKEMFLAGLQSFILGAYLSVFSSLSNYISGNLISEWDVGRYSGGGQNAVELALILSISLPVAWHLARQPLSQRGRKIWQWVNYSFLPAAFFAIILTASRTALLAILPTVLYLTGALRHFKPTMRFVIFVMGVALIFLLKSLAPETTIQRLGTLVTSILSGDLGGRVILWQQAWQIFIEHPILGIGSGALSAANQLGAAAHNTFLSVLAELGLVGFLLMLVLLVILVAQIIRQPRPQAALWLTVLFTWLIGVQSLTFEYTKPTWIVFSFIALSAGLSWQLTPEKNPQPVRNNLVESRPILEETIPAQPLRRPRGRPKGSKNKPKPLQPVTGG